MTNTSLNSSIAAELDLTPAYGDEEAAAVAKALAHPARIRILRLLLEKQSCIGCDIVEEIGLAQSTVSEHLRILKSAGVITAEATPPRICYALNAECLIPLAGLLNTVFEQESRDALKGSICCTPAKGEPRESHE